MRRIFATIVASLGLLLGSLAGPVVIAPSPAEADTVSMTTTRAICIYIAPPTSSYYLKTYRTIHYGTAHVTQCEYWQYNNFYYTCRQYVWNVPSPSWDIYKTGTNASLNFPNCW